MDLSDFAEEGGRALDGSGRQTLLLDADDTLWENSVHFERAIADFIRFLDHASHTPAEVRRHLDAIEFETIAERGYGTESFRLSLLRCFETLSRGKPSQDQHAWLMGCADSIVTSKIELMEGVQETLLLLMQQHRMILVTKGNRQEQMEKLKRSGLTSCFVAIEVLREKDANAYRELGCRHGCDPRHTWMIGNSPRSDINPALAAGFHAVLIPHANTWHLEQEELCQPAANQHLLVLESLSLLAGKLSELCG